MYENRIKTLTREEIEREIKELEKLNQTGGAGSDGGIMQYAIAVREHIEFAYRLQLVSLTERQNYHHQLQEQMKQRIELLKINKERLALFREQVINPNDDKITSRELLMQSRENEKKSLDEWKRDVEKQKGVLKSEQKHSDTTENELDLDERQRG